MATLSHLYQELELPVIAAPMFIVSGPELVTAQCTSGIIGNMPSLNARPPEQLDQWLHQITEGLQQARTVSPTRKIAPYALNLIIHQSNARLERDLALCEKHRVPIIITSLGKPTDIVQRVHEWGGLVFHDVTTLRHAEKALEAGVDGLIAVAAGAGGHAGTINPIALISEIRQIHAGPLALSGSITTGRGILAALSMGADFAYIGTRFIASREANASPAYKDMIVSSTAADIVYTPAFTGVPGNYLAPSITAAGLDPQKLHEYGVPSPGFADNKKTAWRDIWGAGQGVGSIHDAPSVEDIVCTLKKDFLDAKNAVLSRNF